MSRRLTVRVTVTEDHWNDATYFRNHTDRARCASCPVALALNDALGREGAAWVTVSSAYIPDYPNASLPQELSDLALAFDIERPFPGPVTATITFRA